MRLVVTRGGVVSFMLTLPRCIPVQLCFRIDIHIPRILVPSPLLMHIQLLLSFPPPPLLLLALISLLHIAHNLLNSIMTSRIRILSRLTLPPRIRDQKTSYSLRDTVLEFRCSPHNLLDTASQEFKVFLLPELAEADRVRGLERSCEDVADDVVACWAFELFVAVVLFLAVAAAWFGAVDPVAAEEEVSDLVAAAFHTGVLGDEVAATAECTHVADWEGVLGDVFFNDNLV